MHGIIDGDMVCHMAASACEDRWIEVTFPDGTEESFENRTALKVYCEEKEIDYKACKVEDEQFPEALPIVLSTAEKMAENWAKMAGCSSYELYVGKETGFRAKLPLPEKYKGNRDGTLKAVYVDNIKDHFLTKPFGNLATDDLESDDWLSIRAYEGYLKWLVTGKDEDIVVQITADKDACGCTGWLFNPDKDAMPHLIKGVGDISIDKKGSAWKLTGTGLKFLLSQVLMGDTVDNYKPTKHIKRQCGPVKVYDILSPCETPKGLWEAVVRQYQEWFGDEHTYTTWDGSTITCSWKEMLQLYLDCARMRRTPDDIVSINDILNKFEIEGEEV